MRNTHSSTAIEGNPLTLEQVRLIEEGHGLPAEPPRAKREVLNSLAGLRHSERHPNKNQMAPRDAFTLHTMLGAEVMDQGDAGRYTLPAQVADRGAGFRLPDRVHNLFFRER